MPIEDPYIKIVESTRQPIVAEDEPMIFDVEVAVSYSEVSRFPIIVGTPHHFAIEPGLRRVIFLRLHRSPR